jgi:LysM repeat protein
MANGVTYGVHVSHTLIANGELIGAIGDQNSEDGATYGQNYLPINDRSLTAAPSAYTVQTGDTLQSIAKAMWGDGNLWYAIAEANGYASVTVGQVISIPSRPDVEYNDAQTYKPYDASAIIGDTTPTAPPPPPPKKHHSLLGSILAIIVAVVAVVFTAGAALGALAPELFAEAGALEGMSVMEAGAAFVESGGAIVASTGVDMAAMGAAALAGAAGSAAGQLVNMAAGNQDKFSWNGVAFGALSAGITQGLGGVNLTGGAMNSSANVIARAAIGSALTQGAAVVTGLQSHFDWHGVVGSAVAAGVGQAVGDALGRANINPRVNAFVTGAAHNAATALVRGGKVSFEQIAADAFGNALGQGLVDQASSNYRPSYLAAGEPASDEPFAGGAFRYDTGSVGAKQMGDATFNALKKMMSVPAVTASSSIEEVEGLAGPEYLSQTEVDRENYLLASRSRTITGTSPSGIMTRDGSNYYLITRDANGLGVYQRPEDPMVPTMFTQNTSSPSPSPNATDYSDFFVTRPGRPYRADQIVRQSHYNDPIDTSDGRLAGNSRIWGDAPATTQQASIEALVNSATTAGLTTRQTALVLAIAHTESGFNPDAAAGTTSASGLGQFIDSTGAAYGVNASNRWDVNAQADALVQHFLDNTQLADTRGQGEDYIYKYHHDGPKGNYGGLDLSRKIVIPLANQYELLLQGRR